MAEYIAREALLDRLKSEQAAVDATSDYSSDYDRGYWNGLTMAQAMVLNAPTIDAVPVVRCRDCKHWDKFVGEEHRGFCFAWKVDSYDEDFCSYGTRKENNND